MIQQSFLRTRAAGNAGASPPTTGRYAAQPPTRIGLCYLLSPFVYTLVIACTHARTNTQNSFYRGGGVQRGEMVPRQFSEQHDDPETGDPSSMHSSQDDSIAVEHKRRRGEGSPEDKGDSKKICKGTKHYK